MKRSTHGPTLEALNKYINHTSPFIKITNSINISPLLASSTSPTTNSLKPSYIQVLEKETMSSGDWMCGSCQHLNFKKRDSCHRCRFPKLGGDPDVASYGINRTEVLAGDWYCNTMNCGAHNYASRTSCYRCGVSKEDCNGYGAAAAGIMGSGGYAYNNTVPPGWKTGDWICNRLGCGVHNYASRTECHKCKTLREYGGAA